MLIANKQLNPDQLTAVNNLADLCLITDGGLPALYTHLLVKHRPTENNVYYFQQDSLLGFLSVYFFYQNACEISLLIAPSHRRQGIAKQLLRTILPLLRTKKMQTVIFSTAPVINEPWLTQLGFLYQHSEYCLQRKSYEPILGAQSEFVAIRKATISDLPTLCAIDTLCFPNESEQMFNRFVNILNDASYTILLISYQEKTIGKAHIFWQEEKTTFSDIAIMPSYQGRGLGGQLLSYCINFALNEGKMMLELDVETSNQNALNLYLRHGFNIGKVNDYWNINLDKLSLLLEKK